MKKLQPEVHVVEAGYALRGVQRSPTPIKEGSLLENGAIVSLDIPSRTGKDLAVLALSFILNQPRKA